MIFKLAIDLHCCNVFVFIFYCLFEVSLCWHGANYSMSKNSVLSKYQHHSKEKVRHFQHWCCSDILSQVQRFLKFADKKARGLRSQADSTMSENSRSKWGYYSQNYYTCYFIWIPVVGFWPVSWNLQSNVSGVDFLWLSHPSWHSTTFSLGKASRDISKLSLTITKRTTIN